MKIISGRFTKVNAQHRIADGIFLLSLVADRSWSILDDFLAGEMFLKKMQREELVVLAMNLESHLKRNLVIDVCVVVALLIGAVVTWYFELHVRSMMTFGLAFYYCGRGDGERRVAKRTLNYIDGYGFQAKELDGKDVFGG